VAAGYDLTVIQQAMHDSIRDRAAESGMAALIRPINIGIGTK
jgi:hypothetical protein